jgi:spermidine synthase
LLLLGTGVVVALLRSGGVSGPKILRVSLLASGVLIGAALGTPSLFGQFYEKLLMQDRFTTSFRFADVVENRSGVITVTQDGTVYGSGAYDGRISTSLMDDQNLIIRAYAVAALHRAPRQVLMIGLSTGAWAQVIANDPAVERLTVIEINPGYPDVIERYPQVASLLKNPKVHIVIDDGRRWLTRSRDQFDLIVSNTTFHWRAHTTNLLSREYDWLVRAHLKPGGVYYFNTTGSSAALKTAMTVFPAGLRFMNFAAVGVDSVRFDREGLRRALSAWRIDGHPVVDTTVAMEREKLAEIVTGAQVEDRHSILVRLGSTAIVTDDNMLPEWYPERNH